MIVRLLAVEGERTYAPAKVRIGKVQPLGHKRAEDGSFVPSGAPEAITLDGQDAVADAAFLRKEVLAGRCKPADAESAALLDVPFVAPTKKVKEADK